MLEGCKKTISIIMSASDSGAIGLNNGLPWHNPEDLKWFKSMTIFKTVIVGRKTYETLPRLPNRVVVPVSRSGTSLEDAIRWAGSEEVMIAGGAEVYKAAIPYVDRFYISRTFGEYEADTFSPFPLPWQE